MYDLGDVAWMALAAAAAYYFYRAIRARERIVQAVGLHCRRADVQLLDDTVALRRLWLRFDRGRPRLWRTWHFEYSTTGADRCEGRAFTLGRDVEVVRFEPERMH